MAKGLVDILKLDSLVENISGYLENKLELLKIELKEDAADLAAKFTVVLIAAFLMFAFVIFLSLALGIILNLALESDYLGYLLVAATYLLVFILIIALKEKLGLEARVKKYLTRFIK